MYIGDKLLNGLSSTNTTNLQGILNLCCSYLGTQENTIIAKRVIGACLNPEPMDRPKGCVMFIYDGKTYWRDAWNMLYEQETKKKVGIYYPTSRWASIGYF